MAAKKKAKQAKRTAKKSKSTASARKAAPVRKSAKKRSAAAAKAPKRGKARAAGAAARKPAAAKKKTTAKARAAGPKNTTRAAAKPAIRRRDRPGHIDPKYARELRERSEAPEHDPASFINRPRAGDDLAEELGEETVASATTGEYEGEDFREQEVSEELGGPFVQTSAQEEFAHGTDASNPKGATREPFPRT